MNHEKRKDWSQQIFDELGQLDERVKVLSGRCCRAVLGGAVEIKPFDDPALGRSYTAKLKFCPECGRPLHKKPDRA